MAAISRGKSPHRVAFPALFSALILICAIGRAPAATVPPSMTVVIINNSCAVGACPANQKPYDIYPVLSTGTSTPDKYMQAVLGVPSDQVDQFPYPKTNQYRLYINPTGSGIPPGGSITLTLPFYTQLVPGNQVNPKAPDQYIDWWGGGRIELFDGDATTGQPPAALTADYTGTNPARAKQVEVTSPVPGATLPVLAACKPEACQPLTIFKDPAGLTNNEPTQLTEYTLGALNFNVAPTEPYGLDVHNVDYDVSYVDATYMPVAMEPYNNNQVGYIGSIQAIDPFREAVEKFLAVYKGWPQFLDDQKVPILKVPSPINLFAGLTNPTPRVDLATQPPWAPITALIEQWNTCTAGNGAAKICAPIRDVRKIIAANYQWCTGKAPANVEPLIIDHAYGWTPFKTDPDKPATPVSCPNDPSASHLLEDTPGYWAPTGTPGQKDYAKYQAVKQEFDDLQYWPNHAAPDGAFDPYLVLIHGADYINTDRAYAYSVDDALGNMQVAGDGLIIAVGGAGGLPNPDKATPPINIQFGYTTTPNAVNFVKYGVCTDTPDKPVNPTFASFAISSTNPRKCPLSFLDSENRIYKVTIKQEPPFPLGPPQAGVPVADKYYPSFIDCGGNPAGSVQAAWCRTPPAPKTPVDYGVYVYTLKGNGNASTNQNFVVTRAAVSP